MLPVKAPRDPAPSRVKYRLERLWLRPTIRNSVRIGLPLLAVAWFVISAAMDPTVQAAARVKYAELRAAVASHPGLMVTRLEIDGASDVLRGEIEQAAAVSLPVSSMDLDISAVRERIVALDAVGSAQVRVEGGGLLSIEVEERIPVMVWREPGGAGYRLIDAEGVQVGRLGDRAERPDLPLIAGPGAPKAAAEALELLALAEPIADRVGGLLRVGERRWNVVLRDGREIMLPDTGAASALARVMALDGAEDLLNRDILAVDMRDARRPILRLSPEALLELRRARGEIVEEDA